MPISRATAVRVGLVLILIAIWSIHFNRHWAHASQAANISRESDYQQRLETAKTEWGQPHSVSINALGDTIYTGYSYRRQVTLSDDGSALNGRDVIVDFNQAILGPAQIWLNNGQFSNAYAVPSDSPSRPWDDVYKYSDSGATFGQFFILYFTEGASAIQLILLGVLSVYLFGVVKALDQQPSAQPIPA